VFRRWTAEEVPPKLQKFVLDNASISKSQLQQDLIALYIDSIHPNEQKFFVEFGATNGVDLSNSFILEKNFNWNGILVEPGRTWHKELAATRNCTIDLRCVWKLDGEVIEFTETKKQKELSTISSFVDIDKFSAQRKLNSQYFVETVSLNRLLESYDAPKQVTYLSIDTEGSEYDIISSFNFSQFDFSFISIEHNHTSNEKLIELILEKQGYVRILPNISEWDGWYINTKHSEVCNAFRASH
jgi:FkbM family methyltransferase